MSDHGHPPLANMNGEIVPFGDAKISIMAPGLNCLVPEIDSALFSQVWKDALWDRYFTGAPARQRRSVEQYKIVKRA